MNESRTVIQGGEEDYEGTQYSLSDFKYLLDLKALALKQHVCEIERIKRIIKFK